MKPRSPYVLGFFLFLLAYGSAVACDFPPHEAKGCDHPQNWNRCPR